MSVANWRIEDLQIREICPDPGNYVSEASIDCRGQEVIVVHVRHRGLRHTDDGSILFEKSFDGGRTFDPSTRTVAMAERETWGFTSPACKILRDGTILVLAVSNILAGHRSGGEARAYGGWSARSLDGGRSWSEPEPIHAWPMRGAYPWDNPLEMPDGTLLLAAYGALEDAVPTGTYRDPMRSALLSSDDKGKSWYYHGTIAYDAAHVHHFGEPGIALAPDGRLIALSRHMMPVFRNNPPGGWLFFSESEDGGVSWTPFRRTGVWGYPADPVVLQDGRILAVYGHRKDPMSIKAVVSPDGRTWSEENAAALYEAPNYDTVGIAGSKGAIDSGYRHIGYPSAVVLDDGAVLAVFHSFNADRKQIVLLARFRVGKG